MKREEMLEIIRLNLWTAIMVNKQVFDSGNSEQAANYLMSQISSNINWIINVCEMQSNIKYIKELKERHFFTDEVKHQHKPLLDIINTDGEPNIIQENIDEK